MELAFNWYASVIQLVLPMRSLDAGMFMHPNQGIINFRSRIKCKKTGGNQVSCYAGGRDFKSK